ncbi:hypothetical protein HWE04_14345 [Herbaspirillum sp. C7C2]|uniref:hypothetical protein n=1 Tax=Herbaspirillum sp. C7C2 TaxID=2736666 RepID=UPI001F51A6F3|nr:hypothetical protein [Herbaspirillum sp. C7C2]MCI1015032.1 hypothetical protein [Herbaspirillum sp. C7C2]
MLHRFDVLPDTRDVFVWADYIELRALAHPDKCFSRGELAALAQQVAAIGQPLVDANAIWREVKEFINNRAHIFGAAYPFTIVGHDEDTLELTDRALNGEEKLYLTLLICSSMAYVVRQGGNVQMIGRLFEECSLEIFQKLMPPGSKIYPAWAAGGAAARYQGSLYQKLLLIARDLRGTATIQERDYAPQDHGDGGIDIVSWDDLDDPIRGAIPSALAQCGCSREQWRTKHIAASPVMLRSKINVHHNWATYYFMPLDLRWSDGDWAYKGDFGEAIIIDRLRMISLARRYNIAEQMPIRDVVETASQLQIM